MDGKPQGTGDTVEGVGRLNRQQASSCAIWQLGLCDGDLPGRRHWGHGTLLTLLTGAVSICPNTDDSI